MSIRTSKQDRLKERATPLSLVPQAVQDEVDAELVFMTEHETKPYKVDLREFFYGGKGAKNGRWSKNFKARPMLILQLAPAIRDSWQMATKAGALSKVQHLRKWFRLLDDLEERTIAGSKLRPVDAVEDLTDLHGQLANEQKVSKSEFSTFKSVVDKTRAALGLSQLLWGWQGDRDRPIREVPSHSNVAAVFHQLKRRWFGALDRWERVESLCNPSKDTGVNAKLNLSGAVDLKEARQLLNWLHYRINVKYQKGRALLSDTQTIRAGLTQSEFRTKGLHIGIMLEGHFPNANDTRAAFHLCLLGTGWNPQTLLDLPVHMSDDGDPQTPFLISHPTNPARYVMRGHKMRGASDPPSIGDWKASRSPGTIIRALVEQTAPIRRTLQIQAEEIENALSDTSLPKTSRDKLERRAEQVARLILSPWLYVEQRGTICALNESTYYSEGFLKTVVDEVNRALQPKDQVGNIVATDLRDAYGSFAFGLYGGSIKAVRFALHHRSLRSTNPYLTNRLLSQLAQREFVKFETFLWLEIVQRGKVDPTVLAKLVRDGKMTSRERFRLKRYRDLRLSRLKIHCGNPTSPPKRVDPNFKEDGKSKCVAHRCLLCYEHAAVSAESIDGVCMRKAELIHMKGTMSVHAFTSDLYQEEDENADSVLSMFPPQEVARLLEVWKQRIASGEHRVLEFVGIQGK